MWKRDKGYYNAAIHKEKLSEDMFKSMLSAVQPHLTEEMLSKRYEYYCLSWEKIHEA